MVNLVLTNKGEVGCLFVPWNKKPRQEIHLLVWETCVGRHGENPPKQIATGSLFPFILLFYKCVIFYKAKLGRIKIQRKMGLTGNRDRRSNKGDTSDGNK